MILECAFKDCNNVASKLERDDGVVYFRFPRDAYRCAEWVTVVAQQRCQEMYTPDDSSVVCSDHFAEKDMFLSGKGLKLHPTAIPSAIVQAPETEEEKDAESSDEGNDSDAGSSETSNQDLYKKTREVVYNLGPPSKKDQARAGFQLKGSKNDLIQTALTRYCKMLRERNDIIHELRKKNERLLRRNKNLKETLKEMRRRIELDSTIGRNICKALFLQYIRKYGHLYRNPDAGEGNSRSTTNDPSNKN